MGEGGARFRRGLERIDFVGTMPFGGELEVIGRWWRGLGEGEERLDSVGTTPDNARQCLGEMGLKKIVT